MVGRDDLSEEAVHAGQAPVLAGQRGLDVLVRRQLRQVAQRCYRRLTAQHLGGYSLNVTGCHVAWKVIESTSQKNKRTWRVKVD